MKPKLRILIAFSGAIAAMGFLLDSSFNNETMVYYTTVREIKSKNADAYDRGYRVNGKVVPGTVAKAQDRIQARFEIEDEGERLQVIYNGILPDTFKENQEVLIEGKYQGKGIFHATNVFTKCASKYEAEPAAGKI